MAASTSCRQAGLSSKVPMYLYKIEGLAGDTVEKGSLYPFVPQLEYSVVVPLTSNFVRSGEFEDNRIV
jgi:hypothetical protein